MGFSFFDKATQTTSIHQLDLAGDMDSKSHENVFDGVMVQVGDSGKFQKWYNIIFNLIFVGFATMANFNVIICLATPEHLCKVPGR